jgi:hypothetical protein
MDLSFPSEVSPAPPAFRLRLPAGWEQRTHATAAAFAVDTRSPQGFTVNLLVLLTSVPGRTDLDQLVDALHAAPGNARLRPRSHGRQRTTISGHDAVLSVFTLEDPELPFPLFQARAALLVPRTDRVGELVHCYATCPAALSEHYAAAFRASFSSLALA